MRVALLGGGTAGHLFPSIAVAQRLIADLGADVLFVGATGRLDSRILAQRALPHELIDARPFPYGLSLRVVPALWHLYRSVRECSEALRRFEPDVVFGSGGYVSVAGILAAARLGVPRVCHASDAHPDRANRLVGRWATRITTSYEAAASHFPGDRTTVTGQPVREEFLQAGRVEAREALGISQEAFVLFVTGGSQGARRLNHAVLGALESLLGDRDVCIIHLVGSLDYEDVAAHAREKIGDDERYRCFAFHEQPWLLAVAADLCLTRGGASSLAEMAVVGTPMIIVPYPYAAAHQTLNAAPLADAGAAMVVADADLSSDLLTSRVTELMSDRERMSRMSSAARSVSRPEAAEQIAQIVADAAQTGPDR